MKAEYGDKNSELFLTRKKETVRLRFAYNRLYSYSQAAVYAPPCLRARRPSQQLQRGGPVSHRPDVRLEFRRVLVTTRDRLMISAGVRLLYAGDGAGLPFHRVRTVDSGLSMDGVDPRVGLGRV